MSTRITERWTSRSGIRVRYLDNDPDDATGLPLLFVPGLTDFAEDYLALLEFFAPRRTLVVEVRGRGRSESPIGGYSVADHLTDLRAVLDEECLGRVHVMTFSRGTSWSLELALTEPDRVASLSIGDYQAVEIGMDDTFPERQWATRFRGIPIPDRVQRHVLDALQAASVHRSLWSELGALGIPVLVAHGDQDGTLVDAAAIDRYRASVPGIEIVAIPGAAHDLFRPDRLAYPRAVEAFLRGDFT